MAFLGLFGNFDKPGPGVNKDDPQKTAPVRFFEILGRKFTKLVQLNLIFAIPAIVVAGLMFLVYLFPTHFTLSLATVGDQALTLDAWALLAVPAPLILLSPFMAGLTLVTRNYAREEHAFVWSDFWQSVKNNWKLFLGNGVVCYVFYVVMCFSLLYYYSRSFTQGLFYIPLALCLIVSVLFLFAQYYLPIMFVTFDLKFTQAYRNAFIFSLAGLFRNLLITVVLAALVATVLLVPLSPIVLLVFILLLLFFIFAFISYFVNFTVYSLINRFLIQPYKKRLEEEKNPPEEKKAVTEEFSGLFSQEPFEDETDEDEDEDKYVYVNGKLIKRSELDKHNV